MTFPDVGIAEPIHPADLDTLDLPPVLSSLEPLILPDSDGEPMEHDRERTQIGLLIELLYHAWRNRRDFFAAGNMFLYYSPAQAREIVEALDYPAKLRRLFRGPDFFVVLDVDGSYRRSKWVVWEEGGRYPNLIIELLSPSTRVTDLGKKKDLYEQTFRTFEYICWDYLAPDFLIGWRLSNGHYQTLEPNEHGWLWSQTLNMWIGTWKGTLLRDAAHWLRFYSEAGQLIPTPAEAERQQAEAERQRAETAEAELARLRAQLAERGISDL